LGHPTSSSNNNLAATAQSNHISDPSIINHTGHVEDPLMAWNNLDVNDERGPTLEEMEMDFAKLFDPAMEWQSMQTEGSGWPTMSSTGDTGSEPSNANGGDNGSVPI
jgi:hypothetical protein